MTANGRPARKGGRGDGSSSGIWRIAVLAMFVVAIAIRLPGLADPPLEFQPARQLHSAKIARAYFLSGQAANHESPDRVRAAPLSRAPEIEPPIMEGIAVAGYHVLGGEHLWWPRLVSVMWWTAGGFVVLLLGLRLFGPGGAVVASGVHLLLPFAVAASRSFQPDPMMVSLILGTAFAATNHATGGSRRSLIFTATLGAAAVFVKLVAVFYVLPLILALSYHRGGLRRVVSWQGLVTAAGVLVPAAIYHLYGTYVAGFLAGQGGGRIEPELLTTSFFWTGWLKRMADLLPLPRAVSVAVLGLAAVALIWVGRRQAEPWTRLVLGSMLAGYVAFGLAFTLHYATHDYYHLPLIPVGALCLGAIWTWVNDRVRWHETPTHLWAARGIAVVVGLALVQPGPGILAPRPTPEDLAVHVDRSEEIGVAVDHSVRLGYLAAHFGDPLTYYGDVAGVYWRPQPGESAEQTFERLYGDGQADYFVVADTDLLAKSPGLDAFLQERYPHRVDGSAAWAVYEVHPVE